MSSDFQPKSSVYVVVRDNENALDSLMLFDDEQEAELYKVAIGADAVLVNSEPVFQSAYQCLRWVHDYGDSASCRILDLAEQIITDDPTNKSLELP